MPYREETFLKEGGDVISNLRYSFAQLKRRQKVSKNVRKKLEATYYKCEKALEEFLSKKRGWYIQNIDDFKLLMNLFYPEEKIANLYTSSMDEDSCRINQVYLENIFEIAKSLLTFRDGKVAIRTWVNDQDEKDIFRYPSIFDKVEIWNLLGRLVTTDVFIAAFFVEIGAEEVYYLSGQTNGIFLADKTLEKILRKGVAETHMHFNAGAGFVYLWQEQMDFREWGDKLENAEQYKKYSHKHRITYTQVVYRFLWAEFLEYGVGESFDSYLKKEYADNISSIYVLLKAMLSGDLEFFSEDWKWMNNNFCLKWKISDVEREKEILYQTIFKKYEKYNTFSEIILLFKSLLYFKKKQYVREELHLFMQYLRMKNLYFEELVQHNQIQGLTNFRRYYRKAAGMAYELMEMRKRYEVVFKNLLHNVYLRKLEVRVCPRIRIYSNVKYYEYENVNKSIRKDYLSQIREILYVYRNYMYQAAGITVENRDGDSYLRLLDSLYRDEKVTLPTLGIVFHFIKTEYVDNRIGDTCWIQKKDQIDMYSKHLIVWRNALVKSACVLEELRSEIPYLGEYVVGIDAASEENKTEPWIFAPLYAEIRNRRITKPVIRDKNGSITRLNNLGFTYHVGEEYRHLLSGLRHIDEVIERFHYKAGDRLGHAIALGTDVKKWIYKNEVVVIPIMEQMENLLWIWGKLIHKNWGIGLNAEALEGKILKYAQMVYGNINGLTVHMLYEAYNDKFCTRYEEKFDLMRRYIKDDIDANECNPTGHEHFCKFFTDDYPYGFLWTREKIFCTYFCPFFYQKFMQPILVHVDMDEIPFLEKIQNYLIQKVESIGIYVETNPTSNLAIGNTDSLYMPHILKLNSKGLENSDSANHETLVTVNSDDPLVFNTSSENELAYVYHALTYQGYKKESILKWIDKVREMGVDSSFVKNVKLPSQQIREISKIIEQIDELIGSM